MTLKVIGAGFGRTGTMSLKTALEKLGFGPCYHMVECLPQGPAHWALWEKALAGDPSWDTIFEGFQATVDFPASTSYKALANDYPEAKVVLSVRDPERWFHSTQETIFAPHWMEYLKTAEAGSFIHRTINDYFDDRMHDKDYLIQRFTDHADAVQASIPADRLLTFEAKQGWAPLCAFLEVPIPASDYPRINDSEATKTILDAIIANGPQAVFGYSG